MTKAGLNRPDPVGTPEEIKKDVDEKHAELDYVVGLAKNRLLMGTMRYGVASKGTHDNYDYGAEAARRILRYFETKNTENLIDAVNFCSLEFHHPSIEGTHFTAIDDGEHSVKINRED